MADTIISDSATPLINLPSQKTPNYLASAVEMFINNCKTVKAETGDKRPICFPPTYKPRYIGPGGEVIKEWEREFGKKKSNSGETETKLAFEDEIRAQDAERLVFDMFQSLEEPDMLIFVSVDVTTSGKNTAGVLKKLKPFGMVVPGNLIKTLETDLVIISRKGLFIVEVKAVDDWPKNLVTKSINQCKYATEIYNKFLEQISEKQELQDPLSTLSTEMQNMSWRSILAYPNCNIPEAQYSKKEILKLGKQEMGNFPLWWQELDSDSTYILSKEATNIVVYLFLILKSSVLGKNVKSLAEVQKEDRDEFLISLDHQMNLGKVLKKNVGVKNLKPSGKPYQRIRDEFHLMTPEQLSVWEGGRRQIIEGPPGSGKTLLLKHKAYEIAMQRELKGINARVCIMAAVSIAKEYQKFFIENGFTVKLCKSYKDSKGFTKEMIEESDIFIGEMYYLTSIDVWEESVYAKDWFWSLFDGIFFDDFLSTGNLFQSNTRCFHMLNMYLNSSCRAIEENKEITKYCWIAFDSRQIAKSYLYNTNVLDGLETNLDFEYNRLTTMMRSSKQISERFMQECRPNNDDDDDETQTKTAVYIGHNQIGELVVELTVEKDDVVDAVNRYINILLAKSYVAQEICVIHLWSQRGHFRKNLKSMCEGKGIVWSRGMDTHSMEWPAVIAISPVGDDYADDLIKTRRFVEYSRAKFELIIINYHDTDNGNVKEQGAVALDRNRSF